MDQICPKCATGVCPWRDGIMCRNYVCERDDVENGKADLFKGLPSGFVEIFRGFDMKRGIVTEGFDMMDENGSQN